MELTGLELDSEEQACLEALVREPVLPRADLLAELTAYQTSLPELAAAHPMMDLDLAQRIGAACERLMSLHDDTAPLDQRRLIQAAVRYFIEDEDAAGDLESYMGFDDDAEVVNAVATHLGHPDWRIEL